MCEIHTCVRDVEHTMEHLQDWMTEKCIDTPFMIGPAKSYILAEPLGVVAVLGSWNYPLATAIAPVINAIAAGNCVILKPSEIAPYTSRVMKKLFAFHLDSNAYQCVQGAVQVAIRATSSPVDLIIFTGSTEKGRLVAAAAAKNLVPCILELGGKSPVVVDKSADVEFAAMKLAHIAFMNSGQLCIRSDYVLCEHSLVQDLIKQLKKQIEKQTKEGSNHENNGKVINEFHQNRLCKLLSDHGGTVVIGNENAHQDKNLTPTVVLNPLSESPLMQDETFGPILPIIPVKNIDEAIKFI